MCLQGLGLFAARDLEKHTMVIEYIGQLIRNEVAEMREKIYEKQVITDLQLALTFFSVSYIQFGNIVHGAQILYLIEYLCVWFMLFSLLTLKSITCTLSLIHI